MAKGTWRAVFGLLAAVAVVVVAGLALNKIVIAAGELDTSDLPPEVRRVTDVAHDLFDRVVTVTRSSPDWPRPPDDQVPRPDPVPPKPDGSGPYKFLKFQEDGSTPVRYDPCAPIHVVVNPQTRPAGGTQLLREALKQVSEASGLKFVLDGDSPMKPLGRYTPQDLYGDNGKGWRPMLVYWTSPRVERGLKGDIVGLGGSASISLDNTLWYVSGTVWLDGPQLVGIIQESGGRAVARSVIMHEFAHVLGLDHVESRKEVMYPSTGVTVWGSGDRAGLAVAGAGPCIQW